jgi:hypothetical protein
MSESPGTKREKEKKGVRDAPLETKDFAQCFILVSKGWGRLLAGARKSAASVSVIGKTRSRWVESCESGKSGAWRMRAI